MEMMRYSVLFLTLLFGCSTEPALVLEAIPSWFSWSDKGVVVPKGSGNAWDNKEVMPQGIVKRGDTYYLYYIGAKKSCNCVPGSFASANSAIGLATSKDGVNFTKHPNNPIVRHEMDSQSEEDGIRSGFIQFDEHTSQFVMYYAGEDTVSPGSAEVDSWVYYRTSSDGINWSSERTATGIGAKGGEAYPDGMVRANGKYHLWWHYAEGPTREEGQWHYYADGTKLGEFATRGKIAGLNLGWTRTTPWLHDDGNTVSLLFFWNSPSRTDPYTSIATTKLSEPLKATVKRWTTDGYALRPNLLLDGSTWRLYSINHENSGESAARLFTAGVAWHPLASAKELLLEPCCKAEGSVDIRSGAARSPTIWAGGVARPPLASR
jgi:hypothetical protein